MAVGTWSGGSLYAGICNSQCPCDDEFLCPHSEHDRRYLCQCSDGPACSFFASTAHAATETTFDGANWSMLGNTTISGTITTLGGGLAGTLVNQIVMTPAGYPAQFLNTIACTADGTTLTDNQMAFFVSTTASETSVKALTLSGDKSAAFTGVIFPQQAPTSIAPSYVIGGIYFDTTLNKLRVGGASGWETVTSI